MLSGLPSLYKVTRSLSVKVTKKKKHVSKVPVLSFAALLLFSFVFLCNEAGVVVVGAGVVSLLCVVFSTLSSYTHVASMQEGAPCTQHRL